MANTFRNIRADSSGGGAVDSVNGQTGVVVLDKTDIGLSNVDNTSDANKPVSTATQTALNLKANLASPALTGIPTTPTAAPLTGGVQVASQAYVDAAVTAGGGGSGITALSGDVSATGPGSVSSTINSNVVTNAKAAQMAANTIKGNNTGSTANASDLTVAQVLTLLKLTGETDNGSSGASKTIDFSTAAGQLLTLTANCTLTFINMTAGVAYALRIVQGGAGSYTVTYPAGSIYPNGGVQPILSTAIGSRNLISIYYDGSNYYIAGSVNFL
jgi:hypothetical protein